MKWISVKDKLPRKWKEVLLYSTKKPKRGGKIIQGWCSEKKPVLEFSAWAELHGDRYNITHWMPLPEPPKK